LWCDNLLCLLFMFHVRIKHTTKFDYYFVHERVANKEVVYLHYNIDQVVEGFTKVLAIKLFARFRRNLNISKG
jgi:hypothetical protein